MGVWIAQRTPGLQAPPGLELTGEYFWRAEAPGGGWRDVHPSWNEPIFRALAAGVEKLHVVLEWSSADGDPVNEWYTISFRAITHVCQTHNRTGTVRRMRAVQWVTPTGTYVRRSQPTGADSALVFLPYHPDGLSAVPVWL